LATCYLMLFNPRNETNDYALLSVAIGYWLLAIGYWVAVSKHRFHSLKFHVFCWFFVLGFVASKYIVTLTPGMWAWWKPVMGIFFTLFLLQRLFMDKVIAEAGKIPKAFQLAPKRQVSEAP